MPPKKKITSDDLITAFVESCLENEQDPLSVYKFCKDRNIDENEFYGLFGSFESLKQGIWNRFHNKTVALIETDKRYLNFSAKEKLLSYFFTLFENLTLNRSYLLFTLRNGLRNSESLGQLSGIREHILSLARGLIAAENEKKSFKILKKSEAIFSEAVWVQFLFLLNFWLKDSSSGFEKTDVAIEKSVKAAFDIFDSTPLESIVDLGKFLWKEKASIS